MRVGDQIVVPGSTRQLSSAFDRRGRGHAGEVGECRRTAGAIRAFVRPGRVAVQAMGGLLHRKLFDLISMPTVRGQGSLLRWYFDWWHRRPDPWGYATEPYEIYKYGKTLEHLHGRDYKRILDVACSEGVFTSQLAATYPHASVDGVDISARAVSRARARNGSTARFHEIGR